MVDDWAELCRLARQGLRLAGEQGRLAESFELLAKWHALAEAAGDRRILEESAREMVWILEGWDRVEEARRLEYRRATQYDDQMALAGLQLNWAPRRPRQSQASHRDVAKTLGRARQECRAGRLKPAPR